jgi:single-strand DNA-binding protein
LETKNVVVLIGRLTKAPALKYLDSGSPVANFSIAVNRSVRQANGSFSDELDGFFDCELYGGQAITAAETFDKGSEACVVGSLLQKKFQSKGDNPRTISRIEIRVRSIAAPLKVAKLDDAPAPTQAPAPQPA